MINEMTMEQIEARMAEISTELETDGADLEALNAEVDALNQRKADIAAEAETRKAEIAEVMKVATPTEVIESEERKKMENIEVRNTKEYIDAFANYIKTNDDSECRALLTENVSGTVPVPELVYEIIKTAWDREGIMRRVRKSYLKGNLKVGFELSADGAVVHTEGAAAPNEEALVLGIVELIPVSLKKWLTISDEAMDLTGENLLRFVYDEVTYRIAKKAADELIAKIKAASTASTSTAVGVPTVKATTVGLGTIAEAIANLSDEAANPVVMMNKLTYAAFKSAQYAANFAADPFEGLPVEFNNTITAYSAATTGVPYVIVGDLNYGALANFPNGEEITFKYDDLSLAEKDLVKIVGREYVALGIVAPNAFVKVVK